MAITTINSASSLYEGSSSAETIRIESGAATNTTVNAAGGNDSISFVSAANGASQTALYVDANAGADEITVSGGNLYLASSTILGGAGGDTIKLDGAALDYQLSEIKAGDGSDVVSGNIVEISGTTINLGAGADTLVLSGGAAFTSVLVQGGSGADEIEVKGQGANGDLSATTVLGGGGADLIVISGQLGAGSLVNGDSTVNGGGVDTINITVGSDDVALAASATIKGKGGADEITVGGSIGNSARIEGNAGADAIILSGAIAGDMAFIGGGSGNDTLTFGTGAGPGTAATIQGGGGADFIDFTIFESGANATGTKIYGGAGEDTIDLGNAFTGQIANGTIATGVISFAALTDSTLENMDEIDANANISGINIALDTAAGITSFTVGAYNDSDADTPSITAGIVSGGSWASADSNVTARATEIDELVSKAGTLVAFNAAGIGYLFIQGGEDGTADDAVIEMPETISGAFNVATDYHANIQFE